MDLITILSQPWHWSISGLLIVVVMVLLLLSGGQFGVSSNLRILCSIAGAGKKYEFFNFDWKSQIWNLIFILGAVIGGYIASNYLQNPLPVAISETTQTFLSSLGIATPQTLDQGSGYVPAELFALTGDNGIRNWVLLIIGGFMIGFGTRWAGGCTSGHAISGLANLQLSSLIAVIGFFIGGLLMTWIILPLIFS